MKDNGEGKEFTPSFSTGEPKISAEEGEIVNDDDGYFGSYTKEEHMSDLKSSIELPNEVEYTPPPAVCEVENSKETNMMQSDAHSSDFCTYWQHDEDEIPNYEILSDFCRDYTSLQPYDIPSPSYSVNELIRSSNVDVYAKKETYAVDLCHKKFEHVCQPVDEGNFMGDLICEPHHLSGSLKEDRENLMAAMNNIVDINALMARGCWKASGGEIEGAVFLEECIALKEGMVKMKEIYVNLLF